MPNSSIKDEKMYRELRKDDTLKRARELGLSGYSHLTKQKLIAKLRDHRKSALAAVLL